MATKEENRADVQYAAKAHLVTFATTGPPGLPLLEHVQQFSVLAKQEGGIDAAHIYTPQKMRELGQDWCVASYSDDARLHTNINPTYHLIGLGAWAFVCIFDVLENHAAPNELVVYHNINIAKYPHYIERAKNLRQLGESCLKFHEAENFHGMITGERIGCTCKYETLLHASREWSKYYLLAETDPLATRASLPASVEELARVPMQRFNFLAIRNTEASRKFFKMLVAECRKHGEDILAPSTQYPHGAPQPHGVWFFRHTADQAVFNAFAAQNSVLTHGVKNLAWLKAFSSNPPHLLTGIGTNYSRVLTFYNGVLFIGQRLAPSGRRVSIQHAYTPERTELAPVSKGYAVQWFLTNDSATAPAGEMVILKRSSDPPQTKESAIWRAYTHSTVSLSDQEQTGSSHRCYLTLVNDGIAIVAVSETGATLSRSYIAYFGALEAQPLFLEIQENGDLVVYSDQLHAIWRSNTVGK